MTWEYALLLVNLIGIASNLDNLSIGMAYGTENVRFPHKVNMIINFVGLLTALIGSYLGEFLSAYIPNSLGSVMACIILCGIGLYILYSRYVSPLISNQPMRLREPTLRDGFLLGGGLSFTNVAGGLGATLTHPETFWWIVASITIWGYLFLWIGHVLGNRILLKWLGRFAPLFGGLLLIGVGLSELYV